MQNIFGNGSPRRPQALVILGIATVWTLHAARGAAAPAGEECHDDHEQPGHADEPHAAAREAPDDHADEDEGLRLTPEQRERFGVVVRTAGPGALRDEVRLTGEIVFNEDRVVHMAPRVPGVVREVRVSMGDRVAAGDVMAVIESRELADAKAEYLAARSREVLAAKTFEREDALREKQVSSEQDHLQAGQALAEARIASRSAEQKLHALGLAEASVKGIADEHDETITRFEVIAPISGIVTEKHIALGENLATEADIFTVVDLGSVWANLTVYAKDLASVRKNRSLTLRADHDGTETTAEVSMVTPFVAQATRSATARVVLENADGAWLPGTFVTAFIGTSRDTVPVVVPRHAVQNIEGRDVVFVEHAGAFELAPVTVGRTDRTHVEIAAGLAAGTPYVAEGAFHLKATVVTRALGSHAGHGH